MRGDIGDATRSARCCAQHRPRAIVNFAAESHVDRSIHGPGAFVETNVVGTFALLEAARAYWSALPADERARVPLPARVDRRGLRLARAATTPPFTETTPYAPNSPYSASRRRPTTWCAPTTTPTACRRSRPTARTTTGRYQFPEKLIPLMIVNALAGKPLPVYGDGRNVRDWLYVGDHCAAIRAVLARGRPGETYNVGGNAEMANIEVVRHAVPTRSTTRRPRARLRARSITFVERPARARPPLRDRRDEDPRELGWRRARRSRPACARPSTGTSTTASGLRSVQSGEYRQWVDAAVCLTPQRCRRDVTRKGIILAGGSGTRLYPVTQVVSKQLLPVYDKPMIYYPLSTLMLAGIRDILVISTPRGHAALRAAARRRRALGHRHLATPCSRRPTASRRPSSSAATSSAAIACALVLGDNIFYGHDLAAAARSARRRARPGATVFAYPVADPERYGVVEFDATAASSASRKSRSAAEVALRGHRPLLLRQPGASTSRAGSKPSARGELEITDVNRAYLERGALACEVMGRGIAWLDTGTHESLLEASQYIETIEHRQGLKIACPEEIAYRMGYIDAAQLEKLGTALAKNGYGQYLLRLLDEPDVG